MCSPYFVYRQTSTLFLPFFSSPIDPSVKSCSPTRSCNEQLNDILDKYNILSYEFESSVLQNGDTTLWYIIVTCDYADVLNLYYDLLLLNHFFERISISICDANPDGTDVYVAEIAPIVVSPNPVQDDVSISGIEPQWITLYDAIGRIVLKTDYANRIDMSHLPQGLYFLHIISNEGKIYTKKLLKR